MSSDSLQDVREWSKRLALALALFMLFGSGSCIINDSHCGEHQVPATNQTYTCVCAPNYVADERGYGCVPCKANETGMNDKCVCKPGYARAGENQPCEKVEGSLAGSACSEAQACSDPNPYCALSESPAYCTTQGCSKHDDCPADWRCAQDGGGTFCKQKPNGLEQACNSTADCADTEAKYCESFMTHQCIIRDCAAQPDVCPSQWVCCDLSSFVGTSLCVRASAVVDGLCPDGSQPVTQ